MLYSRENYSSNLHFRPKTPRIKANLDVLIVFQKVDEKKLRSVEVRLHSSQNSPFFGELTFFLREAS